MVAMSDAEHGSVSTEELLAAAGIPPVTEEGKARARQKLDRAAAARTPARRAAIGAKLGPGLPPQSSAA